MGIPRYIAKIVSATGDMAACRNQLWMIFPLPDAEKLAVVLRTDFAGIESLCEHPLQGSGPEFEYQIFPVLRKSQICKADILELTTCSPEDQPRTEWPVDLK